MDEILWQLKATRIGKENFKNRLGIQNDIDFKRTHGLPNGAIGTSLKKLFNMATHGG